MRVIQMTLDDDLVARVDEVVKKLHTTRSSFLREALRVAINDYKTKEMEARHQKGYENKPVAKDEFS